LTLLLGRQDSVAQDSVYPAAALRREVVAQNPAYRPALAQTLTNLGALYEDTHRFGEAEAAYKEAAALSARWRPRTRQPTGPSLR